MRIYIIGSLREPRIGDIATRLRNEGHDVFDDWRSPGEQTDEKWMEYERARGRKYTEALAGSHAWNVFSYDKAWLDWADAVVLVLPAGKSAHLELGYAIGRNKLGYILLDGEPERYDIMYLFASGVLESVDELVSELAHGPYNEAGPEGRRPSQAAAGSRQVAGSNHERNSAPGESPRRWEVC